MDLLDFWREKKRCLPAGLVLLKLNLPTMKITRPGYYVLENNFLFILHPVSKSDVSLRNFKKSETHFDCVLHALNVHSVNSKVERQVFRFLEGQIPFCKKNVTNDCVLV